MQIRRETFNLCQFGAVRGGSGQQALADSQKVPTVSHMSQQPIETAETPDAAKGIRRTETKLAAIDPERAERIRRDPPQIMDLNEASAYARCGVRTLRSHIRRRAISSIKLGGRVLLERDQLLADLRKLTLKSV